MISSTVNGQDFSNKGTDFWVAYTGHIDGTNSRMALYITSDQNATGNVEINGSIIPFTVLANQVATVRLTNNTTPANAIAYNGQIEGTGVKKGIHITATKPVAVYSHILNAARSGSSLIIPTNTLGKQYYVASYKSNGTNQVRRTLFAVVATVDNTTIEVTPTNADASGIHQANIPFQVKLSKGDVYQFQSNEDLTGSYIQSVGAGTAACQPIAVFAGSTWTAMGCTQGTSGDNLYQQLFPFASWGKTYYTAPSALRSFDIFRILVQDATTVVNVNGVPLPANSLISGRFYEINTAGDNTARIITSNKPICVFQYMISQGCDGVNSDPEMIILNAVEQTLNDITVMSARLDLTPPNTNISRHFLNIIYKTNTLSSLKVDGKAPVAAPIIIPGTGYSYIQEDVTASTAINPAHHIVSDSGFICIAYGSGNFESYGYNAGTNVKDLYQFVTLQNQYASVNFPATCSNTPFAFAITLPYLATSLGWDFGNNPNLTPNEAVTNNSPVPDSSFVRDGRTLYVYKLAAWYTFKAVGKYPIKVTANNPTPDGCSGFQEIDYEVAVFDPPVSDWSVSHSGCMGDTVYFRETGNGNGRPIVKWMWNFGDQTTDSIKMPAKMYTGAGTYNIQLQTITDVGCISDTIKTLPISSEPAAFFRVSDTACASNSLKFIDSSTIATGTIVQWNWSFGDGNTLVKTTGETVANTYAIAGTYIVSLTVVSETGCSSAVFSKPVTVRPLPVADFALPNVCLPGGEARFQNASFINDGSPLKYFWSFGDAQTATAVNPVHHYTAIGPFTVQLRATSVFGCVNDTSKTVTNIYPQTRADAVVTQQVCLRDTTLFTDRTASTNNIVKWRWDFGDGSADTSQHPKHRYNNAGTFTVKLFVVTDKGCFSDTLSTNTVVNALPIAAFTTSQPACETKQLTFSSQSTVANGTITRWHWSFGDGSDTLLALPDPFAKQYNKAGNYFIKMALQSSDGCNSDTLVKTVSIHPQPVAAFLLPEVCLTDAFAQFTDSSFIADDTDSSFTYAWNFGDANVGVGNPNTSTAKHPKHSYKAVGNYTVSLAVTSVQGCTTALSKLFTVNGDKPVAGFEVLNQSALCSNTTVHIRNSATVNFGQVTKVQVIWDEAGAPAVVFTDNEPSPGKMYAHQYADFQTPATKLYRVKYRAYSGATCMDEQVKSITINASPRVTFAAMPGICLEADPRQVTQVSEASKMQGEGSFTGRGVSPTGLFNPAIAGTGKHPLQYLYMLNNGCRDSATSAITTWPSPTANWGFTAPACETNNIQFTDFAVAGAGNLVSRNWSFGDGTFNSSGNVSTTQKAYTNAGNYPVALKVFTDSGCQSEPFVKMIRVHPLPKVRFSLPVVCLPAGNAQFFDSSVIADSSMSVFKYQWNFGDGSTNSRSALQNPVHRYAATGPYAVKLLVTSGDGCVDSLVQQLTTIYPQPKATFTSNVKEVCLGEPFRLTDGSDGSSIAISQWNWSFGDGTFSPAKNTSKQYSAAGSYTVKLHFTNQMGCVSDTATLQLTVHGYPAVNAGTDLVVLEGGSATLNPVATGNDLSFRWTPGTYLANSAIRNPLVTPQSDITYQLTVTARGGCALIDNLFVKVLKTPGIPNVFSPNNDGVNDTWTIRYLESYPGATIHIFNRNGQQVFSSIGYAEPWNGTMNGSPLPVGTYYYVINPKNGRKQMTGSVSILR